MTIGSVSQPTEIRARRARALRLQQFRGGVGKLRPGVPCNADRRARQPVASPGDLRPFDFIVIGAGTFGAATAEHLWFPS